MPIDLEKARGAKLATTTGEWGQDQVILYHLGIGAGTARPTDPKELEYTYEKNLKVLPSYGVIPVFGAVGGMAGVPGIQINFALVLHGEQDIEIHRPIPVRAKIESAGRIAGIYDKGKAALIVIEVETREVGGDKLFTNRFSIFARGEGGFGGDAGPKAGNDAPSRAPDAVVSSPTLPHQALLYRLSGDKNPLHADPDFAKLGGFDKPILHGLCSFGIVCKAVVDELLGGDVKRVARYQVRFAGVVFPGETIETSMWREGNKILIAAKTKERGTPVISNAAITLRD
ncbi:MAG: 3-alpha,7-alpha,12-alpha-trihydroxy-5-beta-cholest-24-enoyl-CoA hydratase [Deltaproteobacteria bacterium]|nr:3-alpha,7-alpha,12-alpha-trihydroxy-5-beta-cholest-24-enoyl-CoA hydratase [Deltaproteobacteria bacterium]